MINVVANVDVEVRCGSLVFPSPTGTPNHWLCVTWIASMFLGIFSL